MKKDGRKEERKKQERRQMGLEGMIEEGRKKRGRRRKGEGSSVLLTGSPVVASEDPDTSPWEDVLPEPAWPL